MTLTLTIFLFGIFQKHFIGNSMVDTLDSKTDGTAKEYPAGIL
jgi:hypothetical protein